MHIWEYLLLFLTPFIGGIPAFFLGSKKPKLVRYIMLFNGAFILGVVLVQLLPDLFSKGDHYTGLWMLLGFALQMLLEEWSGGVEHGHVHTHGQKTSWLALSIMLGLCLHALIEGLPLGGYRTFMETFSDTSGDNQFYHLLLSITIHNIPAAFALTSFLLMSGIKKWPTLILLLVFALMAPIAAFSAQFFLQDPQVLVILLSMVTGNLLQIGSTILFENDAHTSHRFSAAKWLALALGFGLSAIHFH
ncbi:MAG TPA: ZIP family metal transporter [Haliscomenobacter sp.]|uniref:Zinc/iron permease n=1 Tax=Haliscomenobacter hydrossis (strain ATCC 27775 / DSM 1100 / LMG 10767 / O) TaxID=760192 RepID=F4KY02_HALH1|nr:MULTISPECIES: ZIP family metal transporter [Haliscomenobacter]AEE53627.1 zinc/iron permease [Haliscomenobacter hydrossis DSM 1100]HOY18695.1 ZIP family metal transporter [Haliscomenobacter sp.]